MLKKLKLVCPTEEDLMYWLTLWENLITIFSEFFGKGISSKEDFEGDVKYHLGAFLIESLMEM